MFQTCRRSHQAGRIRSCHPTQLVPKMCFSCGILAGGNTVQSGHRTVVIATSTSLPTERKTPQRASGFADLVQAIGAQASQNSSITSINSVELQGGIIQPHGLMPSIYRFGDGNGPTYLPYAFANEAMYIWQTQGSATTGFPVYINGKRIDFLPDAHLSICNRSNVQSEWPTGRSEFEG